MCHSGTIPEPTEVRTGQRSARHLPPPKSRSPIKTHLGSPPKKAHLFQTRSSPTTAATPTTTRSSKDIARKLFTASNTPKDSERTPIKKAQTGRLENGTKQLQPAPDIYGGEDEETMLGLEGEDSILPINNHSDDAASNGGPDPIDDTVQDEISPEPPKAPETAQKRGRGRPPKDKSRESASNSGLRKRSSPGSDDESAPSAKKQNTGDSPKVKRKAGRPPKAQNTSSVPKPKSGRGPGRPPKVVELARRPRPEASSPAEVKHMPPLPRHNRGLFIKRREDLANAPMTRAGRVSIKPLEYWKGESLVYEPDDDNLAVRGVVRVDETSPEKRKRSAGRPKGRSKRQASESESEVDDAETWEIEPGRIHGGIRLWNPEDQTGIEAEEVEEEIALSAAAIITRDIPGSSFKFAKTLTLPFFGSGMVDLPPGGIKKMKNSRKMQMVFFVFTGRVKVIVNDNEFRIGRGGMWQVPRGMYNLPNTILASYDTDLFAGNFYSIENDYAKPARIFFSQGCEVQMQEELEDR